MLKKISRKKKMKGSMREKCDSLQPRRSRRTTSKFPSSANNTKEDKVYDPLWTDNLDF
jgi:hypothetical protein